MIGPDDRLTAWDKRQPKREDDSTDRVRNWRAEHAKPVTPQPEQLVTHGNAMKRSVTHGNNTDTDTDTDTEQNRTEHIAPLAHDADIPPEIRAINNAYDACGLMTSKTHQDAHLETIKRTGLQAWQLGFAEALKVGKHNIPKYVARCAESAMLTAQRGNGNGRIDTSRGFGLASLTTDADREYHASNTPEAIAELQAEFDRNAAARAAKQAGGVP